MMNNKKKTMIIALGAGAVIIGGAMALFFALKKKTTKESFCKSKSTAQLNGAIDWASSSNIIYHPDLGTAQVTIGPGTVKLVKDKVPTATLPMCMTPTANNYRVLSPEEYSLSEGMPTNGSWTLRLYKTESAADAPTFRMHWSPNRDDGSMDNTHFYAPLVDGTMTLKKAITMDLAVVAPVASA